jgi:bacillithiol biosynthesis deacetylase BshB1
VKLDCLAIGTHPDDVELCCGGTLARLVEQGHRVGILHLTRGERGTRGTAEERKREAELAANALGVEELHFLDCGDGALRHSEVEEDSLIAVLRALEPEILLAPPPSDRHPDHIRAHRLVADAAFYSGLARRGEGAPHRPGSVFSYMQHFAFEPSFIVDVTATWQKKTAALRAYGSQFHRLGEPPREKMDRGQPQTKISSPIFALSVEGRARHFGQMIGAEFGEPFLSPVPLAVQDVMHLLPQGLR